MAENHSSISLSDSMRKSLKILATHRDSTYEELIEDMKQIYDSAIPFNSEKEFCEWFKDNYEIFGYSEIVKDNRSNGFPDFKVRNIEGEEIWVEAELMGENFEYHNHDSDKVDEIVCVWSSNNEVDGVDIKAIEMVDEEWRKKYELKEELPFSTSLPKNLKKDLKRCSIIENTTQKKIVISALTYSLSEEEGIETNEEDSTIMPGLKPEVKQVLEDYNEG